jgi:hypothetical protein
MAFSSFAIQITTISLLSLPLSKDAMPDFFSTILGKFDLLVKNIENIKSHGFISATSLLLNSET